MKILGLVFSTRMLSILAHEAMGTATFLKLPSTTCMCLILMNVPQCPNQIRKLVPDIETKTVQNFSLDQFDIS